MRRFSAASAGRFGEPAFWREFYARKSKSGPFEWFVDADVAAPAPPKLELEKITCSNGLVWTADSKKVGVAAAV